MALAAARTAAREQAWIVWLVWVVVTYEPPGASFSEARPFTCTATLSAVDSSAEAGALEVSGGMSVAVDRVVVVEAGSRPITNKQ